MSQMMSSQAWALVGHFQLGKKHFIIMYYSFIHVTLVLLNIIAIYTCDMY
jgi:hypothetical protein